MNRVLRIILGDQLNENHSWFSTDSKNIVYAMFEVKQETDYVKHHIQKVVGFFMAMRNFAKLLKSKGFNVEYYKITDDNNAHNFIDNIQFLIGKYNITKVEYQLPDEHRLDVYLKEEFDKQKISCEVFDTEHFFTMRTELEEFSKDRKKTIMEDFYRYMRKKHQIFIEDKKPVGGKWNFDVLNRKKWSENELIPLPYEPMSDCSKVLEEILAAKIETFGDVNSKFNYPISRDQALKQLDYFCKYLLPFFGDYQDAMHTSQDFLFHSKISFALNIKLISPKEVVIAIENTFYQNSTIHISQAEGFIRQVLGWREYMRGVYWSTVRELKKSNFFSNSNKLPDFYWSGNTKLNCVKMSLNNSLKNSYAHHIQRLMVLGNLALLLGVHPDEVDEWYLGVYIDAVEWVQLPNTRGMSQFADGGSIAKPYVSSASYINKMSNYCKTCSYNYKTKTETNSCPFNSLYWAFLETNKSLLENNNRMRMMYSLLNKMKLKDKNEYEKIIDKASYIKLNINNY